VVLGRAADLFDLVTADGERPAGDGGNTGILHPSGSSLFIRHPAIPARLPLQFTSPRNDTKKMSHLVTKKMSHEPIGQHRNIDLAASERRSPNCLRHWRLRADRTSGGMRWCASPYAMGTPSIRQCRMSPGARLREARVRSGAGGHIGGEDVVGVAVQVLAGSVISHRRARVGLAASTALANRMLLVAV
jgi:hypothetical protein